MKKYTALQAAQWFLCKESMTVGKLQVLCYYAYAWTLVFLNKRKTMKYRLFEEPFQGWVHRPVCPLLQDKYREYGFNEIPRYKGGTEGFTDSVETVLESVWHTYGKFDEDQLTRIVYSEEPFQRARAGLKPWESGYRVIQDKDMYRYYKGLLNGTPKE